MLHLVPAEAVLGAAHNPDQAVSCTETAEGTCYVPVPSTPSAHSVVLWEFLPPPHPRPNTLLSNSSVA